MFAIYSFPCVVLPRADKVRIASGAGRHGPNAKESRRARHGDRDGRRLSLRSGTTPDCPQPVQSLWRSRNDNTFPSRIRVFCVASATPTPIAPSASIQYRYEETVYRRPQAAWRYPLQIFGSTKGRNTYSGTAIGMKTQAFETKKGGRTLPPFCCACEGPDRNETGSQRRCRSQIMRVAWSQILRMDALNG